MVVSFDQEDRSRVHLALCQRCAHRTFNTKNWERLLRVRPKDPDAQDIGDLCYDGRFKYTIAHLADKALPPKRSSILRLHIPVKHVLRKSAQCGFCRLVFALCGPERLASGRYEDARVDVQLFYPCKRAGIYGDFVIQISVELEEKKERKDKKERAETWNQKLILVPIKDRPETQKTDDNEDPSTRYMQKIAEEARRWVQECDESHTKCALISEPLLPMRVLDLQASQRPEGLKLVEPDQDQGGRYVALSYVWGTIPFLRLIHQNHQTLLNGISLEDLPRTIQNAVQVTRALGVRYLWVDSLCILQDSDIDKELQIPRMNAYYRGATAVVSASGASDAHAGFLGFQSTQDQIYDRVKSYYVFEHPDHGDMPYRFPVCDPVTKGVKCIFMDVDPPLYNYGREPINERGWTMQESALARRLLIFPSTGGVIMRCSEAEHVAGHVVGDPFAEEPGSVYHEGPLSNILVFGEDHSDNDDDNNNDEDEDDDEDESDDDDDDDNDWEDMTDEDSESASTEIKVIEDHSGKDDGSEKVDGEDRRDPTDEKSDDYRSSQSLDSDESDEDPAHEIRESKQSPTYSEDEHSDTESVQRSSASGNDNDSVEYDSPWYEKKKNSDEQGMEQKANKEREKVAKSWHASVQDYCSRKLTNPEDVLIAFAALAQEYHTLHENHLGTYAAGLWTKTLKQGLLWHLSHLPSPKTISEYRAPSWSWASCEQEITFHIEPELDLINFRKDFHDQPIWCIEVVDYSIVPRNIGIPFGAVQSASIDILSAMIPIRRIPAEDTKRAIKSRWTSDDIALPPEIKTSAWNISEIFAPDSIDALAEIDSMCYWLPIYDATRSRTRGLIVREATGGSHRRLGFAEFQIQSRELKYEKQLVRLV